MIDIKMSREICDAATPGPWHWDIRKCNQSAMLLTDHSGQCYVMGFVRWGLRGATPTFQKYDKYEGPVAERCSRGMRKATEFSRSNPGKEHHEGWDDFIDHPDAIFIAHAASALPEALDELEAARAEVERLRKRCVALENALKDYNNPCGSCVHRPEFRDDPPCCDCQHAPSNRFIAAGFIDAFEFGETRFSPDGGEEEQEDQDG